MITYAKGLYHSLEGSTWTFYKRYVAVSNGTIINIRGHIMKIRKNQNTLSLKDDDDITRTIRVNRFILSSFICDKPPQGYHADHIDEESPDDNSLSNLQWLSVPDNNIKKRKPIRERHSCIPVIMERKNIFQTRRFGQRQWYINRPSTNFTTQRRYSNTYHKNY